MLGQVMAMPACSADCAQLRVLCATSDHRALPLCARISDARITHACIMNADLVRSLQGGDCGSASMTPSELGAPRARKVTGFPLAAEEGMKKHIFGQDTAALGLTACMHVCVGVLVSLNSRPV